MADEKTCPHCGKPVPSTALGGICPECMLKAGLATQTEGPDATGPHGTKVVLPLPKPEEIAPLFPQLEILECLGRGGMGVVYKARQPRLNRLVALKILAREKEQDPQFAGRFTREAQALARLSHPNIVTVYDFGETAGHCYLLMEFVDGLNLRQLLQAGKLKPEQALAIVPKICEALQYAHEQGIVHRDIKPENILLDKQGRVKIADFGIAKMLGTETGQQTLTGAKDTVGTPHYMAPEQIEKPQTVDHRADIYSLGVVFYEMLTGELPLGKFQPPSKKVHIDVRLDEVVLHALEKEPERRYQQVSEVKTVVETIAATSELSRSRREEAQTEGAGSQRRRTSSPAPFSNVLFQWVAVGVAMVIVCLVLLLGMSSEAIGARTWGYFRLSFEILAACGSVGFLLVIYRAVKTKTPETRRALKSTLPWVIVMMLGILFGFWSPHLLNKGSAIKSGYTGKAWLQRKVTYAAKQASVQDIVQNLTEQVGLKYDWQKSFAQTDPLCRQWVRNVTIEGETCQQALDQILKPVGLRYQVENGMLVLSRQDEGTTKSDYIGQTWFPQGDSIEITSVERTKNQMTVKGHYNLVSHDQAELALYVTTMNKISVPVGPNERIQISKSRGEFELIDPYPVPGLPHVSMYGTDGHPFASVYFGTRAEALEESRAAWITNQPTYNGGGSHGGGRGSSKTPEFRPVHETILPALDDRTGILLDLDTGTWATNMEFGADDRETHAWIRSNRVDLVGAIERGQIGILCADMAVVPAPSNGWDFVSAKAVLTNWGLNQQEPNKITPLVPVLDHTDTWLFRTREDGHGVLQILGQSKNPNGVKIRYKLVQTSHAPSATTASTNHPKVIDIWPADGATNVTPRQEIRIRFDQPMNPNDLWIQWLSGGFLPDGQPHYEPDRNEFIIPVQLMPGRTNELVINSRPGGMGGFRGTNLALAEEYRWHFTTRPFAAKPGAAKPAVVRISPTPGGTLPVLTLLKITFDQPMMLPSQSPPYLRRIGWGGWGLPALIPSFDYDPASRTFTLPVLLPPDNETRLTLEGFRSADGVTADPVVVSCQVGTNDYSSEHLNRITAAAKDPQLKQLLSSMKAARLRLTSGVETVQSLSLFGGKEPFDQQIMSHSATFKWQGTNQIYADISDIMNTKAFILGSDGATCWLYSDDEHNRGRLDSAPVHMVAEVYTSIADPFTLSRRTVQSAIAEERLIYEGQTQLEGHLCYRVQSWMVRQSQNQPSGVSASRLVWWIDARTFLPVQVVQCGTFGYQIFRFHYDDLNQPLPIAAFQPPVEPGAKLKSDDWYQRKLGPDGKRFLIIKDGCNGRMSERFGVSGPTGTTSSGLN